MSMSDPVVVALDGPSGTGKSTVARRLATRLGYRYLDTGAMYRAATLAVLQAGIALPAPGSLPASDPQAGERFLVDAARAVARSRIEIATDPARPQCLLDGRSVDAEIRSGEVTAAVSAVSAVPAVRSQLVAEQRRLIGSGRIVVEGRDIGTVVWPQAAVKVFLTADARVRAARRAGEQQGADLAAVAADIERRDRLDSTRAVSPFVPAADAQELDTTKLDIDEVVTRLVDIVREAVPGVDPGA